MPAAIVMMDGQPLSSAEMSNPRPYIDLGIDQLERLVVDMAGASPINDAILSELRHRNTQRALRLRRRLEQMCGRTPKVGVLLLVHRRCSSPMFNIANRIAYENMMVQAKRPQPSPIRDLLGPSHWVDVAGAGEHKWCLEKGREALAMIERIIAAGIAPDLYVVTPFVIVASGLRRLLRDSVVLAGAVPDLDRWTCERIGTIHNVQGREAEAVIFVLGAPHGDQTGARGWAGKEPNLFNVTVTRAKEAVYVVGNRSLWRSAGVFSDLSSVMD